ncbi:hypothetical protein ETD86_12925 [Nonomuraea turkmeniaca]|uniref:Uncharacterized protein n=1 Tax=Nonomuraea turkmeniaca TaxID=103838 RepID=A0A5S4FN17_9ACTN|nr:hypothetical protein [Nonomuraea turkmeniaca]TMR22065.1 hypothetical protein ETD86_12925 [Nonomuraea turkmeniaca]
MSATEDDQGEASGLTPIGFIRGCDEKTTAVASLVDVVIVDVDTQPNASAFNAGKRVIPPPSS